MTRLLDWAAVPCGRCRPGPGDLEPWHAGMCDGCYLLRVEREHTRRRKERALEHGLPFNLNSQRFEATVGLAVKEDRNRGH